MTRIVVLLSLCDDERERPGSTRARCFFATGGRPPQGVEIQRLARWHSMTSSSARTDAGAQPLAGAARGDARGGGVPARVDRAPGRVQVDDHRRVIRRDRLPLARLAIDLRPHHPRRRSRASPAGDRCACRSSCGSCRRGSPTSCSARVRGAGAGRRRPGPSGQGPRRLRRSGGDTCVPPWQRAGSQTSASSGATLKSPPTTSGSPGWRVSISHCCSRRYHAELRLVEDRADRAAVGRVDADHPHALADGGDHARLAQRLVVGHVGRRPAARAAGRSW